MARTPTLRKARLALLSLFLSLILPTNTQAVATTDDDFLLSIIPVLAASAQQGEGLEKIKALHGRWRFHWTPPGYVFDDYYRFNASDAHKSSTSNSFYLIPGKASLASDFSTPWCDGGTVATYNASTQVYVLLCDGGSSDVGDAYVFETVTNSFNFTHYYYTPSSKAVSDSSEQGTATRISNSYRQLSVESREDRAKKEQARLRAYRETANQQQARLRKDQPDMLRSAVQRALNATKQ